MTASVPNGFSSEDLQAMLESAPKEAEMHEPAPRDPSSEQDVIDELADEILNSVPDEYKGPLIHKVMAMKILGRMIDWHTGYGEQIANDGADQDMVTAWLRDAGKFQAAFNILQCISVGSDDFTFNDK